jgi:2-dehydropantoate 2-reductase
MRYIIYGAGGIGGGIGARLHQHGHEVVLIARGEHLARILSHGLTVRAPEETFTAHIPAVDHPSEIAFREDDVVLLTTKTQDSVVALNDLRDAAGPDIPVICAQNGVAGERMAARRFSRVYAMLVMMPAVFLEPGEVILHGTPLSAWLDAGRYPEGLDPLIEQVCADISDSQMTSTPDPAPMRIKYAKLRSNLNNAMDALIGNESRRGPVVKRMLEEAEACFAAAGIDAASRETLSDTRRATFSEGDIPGYPRPGTSAWQSLARGRGIEADFLNGEIVLLGTQHGVPTPYNRAVQILANAAARSGAEPGSADEPEIVALAEQLASG